MLLIVNSQEQKISESEMSFPFLKLCIISLVMLIQLQGAALHSEPMKETASGAIVIDIIERMGEPFELASLTLTLDGIRIYDRPSGAGKPSMIYITNISQGRHELVSRAVYAGTGYKLFPAHAENKYPAELKESIEVNGNEVLFVKVICNDRRGLLRNLTRRPYINYVLEPFTKDSIAAQSINKIDWNEVRASEGW